MMRCIKLYCINIVLSECYKIYGVTLYSIITIIYIYIKLKLLFINVIGLYKINIIIY